MDDARSYFVARGAIERAALHVLWGRQFLTEDGRPIYYVNGSPSMELAFPAADVHVDVIPEASKLSLNAARPEDIMRLLLALGTPEDRATEITAAIVDWRTPVDQLHPSPFDAFYLSQSPSFMARHASFQENEELLLVKGMTAELYYGSSLDGTRAGLRDCLSVYGSAGAVDINTAQPATLQAVGLAPADAATIVKQPGRNIRYSTTRSLRRLRNRSGPPATGCRSAARRCSRCAPPRVCGSPMENCPICAERWARS